MKSIRFSDHSKIQMSLRGAVEHEVEHAVQNANWTHAKNNRFRASMRFEFNSHSPANAKYYKFKTIDVIFVDEQDEIVIVTVKVYYSNEEEF